MSQLKEKSTGTFLPVGDHSLPIRYLSDTTPHDDDYIVVDDGTGAKRCTVNDLRGLLKCSNRNLLDNPWFTVNQRNVTSFSGGSYGVDRWCAYNGTISVNDGYLGFSASFNTRILQWFENGLAPATYTASIMLSDGTVISGSTLVGTDMSATYTFIHTDALDVIYGYTSGKWRIAFSNISNTAINVKAVKLELGSVSTLAYDSAPDYASELLKCQRYFQIIGYGKRVIFNNDSTGHWSISLPVPLRGSTYSVVVTAYGTVYIANSITAYAVTNISDLQIAGNELRGNITHNSVSYKGVAVWGNAYFAISADL